MKYIYVVHVVTLGKLCKTSIIWNNMIPGIHVLKVVQTRLMYKESNHTDNINKYLRVNKRNQINVFVKRLEFAKQCFEIHHMEVDNTADNM